MTRARALACPASLKGVLSARDAAVALAAGLRAWSDVDELPVADGGEGTLDALHAALGGEWRTYDVQDAFGRPRRARALWHERDVVVEAAEVIPLDAGRLDPIDASSRGLGDLLLALETPNRILVGLGGTANVDGGGGMLAVVTELPARTLVACDVDVPLLDAVRVFAAQKGATSEHLPDLCFFLVQLLCSSCSKGLASRIQNLHDLHVQPRRNRIFNRFIFSNAVDEIRNGVALFSRQRIHRQRLPFQPYFAGIIVGLTKQ